MRPGLVLNDSANLKVAQSSQKLPVRQYLDTWALHPEELAFSLSFTGLDYPETKTPIPDG
jgi:hypothetical protein